MNAIFGFLVTGLAVGLPAWGFVARIWRIKAWTPIRGRTTALAILWAICAWIVLVNIFGALERTQQMRMYQLVPNEEGP